MLHRDTLDGLLYSERLEDLRTGDLVWDTVVSIEDVGERECFDFRMSEPRAALRRGRGLPRAQLREEGPGAHRARSGRSSSPGARPPGYGAELGNAWFDIIEPFADYAFNKSHSYGYGFVAYQTAYLKANYPVEYFAALLTSVKTNLDKAAVYLNECRTMGIAVLGARRQRSVSDFAPVVDDDADGGREQRSIPFGLSAVRNVGRGPGRPASSPSARPTGRSPTSTTSASGSTSPVLNKRTIESLIKAGGFDSLGHPRQGLLRSYEQIIDRTVARRREADMGEIDLFGEIEDDGDRRSTSAPPIPDRRVRQDASGSASRRRCSAST